MGYDRGEVKGHVLYPPMKTDRIIMPDLQVRFPVAADWRRLVPSDQIEIHRRLQYIPQQQ